MHLSKSWLLVVIALALSCATFATAETSTLVPGNIVAAKVHGTVTATKPDGSQVQLADAMVVTQQYVINTGDDSSVILVFSNGATVNLGAKSSLSIEEFLQDPFRDGVSLADLKEEPSTSQTKLKLSQGELVGNVKHLKIDNGSSFTVDTPVGAAGIRGTLFRIVFQTDADGHATYSLSTAEGRVLFQAATPSASGVSVAAGTAVTATVDVHVDPTTGSVTITTPPSVSSVTPLTPEAQSAIGAAAKDIIDASKSIILTTPAPSNGSSSTSGSSGSGSEDKTTTATTGTTSPGSTHSSTTPITPPSPDTVSASSSTH